MVLSAIVLFSISSCSNDDEIEMPGGQQVYFEYHHLTDALHSDATVLDGFIINQNGEVRTFSSTTRPHDWKFLANDNFITEQDMQYNLSKTTVLPNQNPLELEKYIQKYTPWKKVIILRENHLWQMQAITSSFAINMIPLLKNTNPFY